MKDNEVKDKVEYLQKQIAQLIASKDMLDDKVKEKMLRNIENLIRKSHIDVSELVEKEIKDVYDNELENAKKEVEQRGIELSTSLDSDVHEKALEQILEDTMEDMAAAYRTARERMIDNIEDTLSQVKQEIADGVMYGNTRKKTIKRVYDDFLNKGLTSFTTVDGKELPLDFYAETVTRTKISTANVHAHTNAYEEANIDLVEVRGAADPCDECAPYHDVVFSVDGKDDRFPQLDVRDVFPLHPNCRCNIHPFVLEYEESNNIADKENKGRNFDPKKDTRTQKQKENYEKAQQKKRQARQEVKQYDKIKGVLGDDAPKTLGAYRRMKRNNTKGYRDLQGKMRSLTT